MLVLSKAEVSARHLAGVISGQACYANVRPHGVDRACRRDAYFSHQRRAAIAIATHASETPIDIVVGNPVEVGVTFQ